jgi:hypothetical protein
MVIYDRNGDGLYYKTTILAHLTQKMKILSGWGPNPVSYGYFHFLPLTLILIYNSSPVKSHNLHGEFWQAGERTCYLFVIFVYFLSLYCGATVALQSMNSTQKVQILSGWGVKSGSFGHFGLLPLTILVSYSPQYKNST